MICFDRYCVEDVVILLRVVDFGCGSAIFVPRCIERNENLLRISLFREDSLTGILLSITQLKRAHMRSTLTMFVDDGQVLHRLLQ